MEGFIKKGTRLSYVYVLEIKDMECFRLYDEKGTIVCELVMISLSLGYSPRLGVTQK